MKLLSKELFTKLPQLILFDLDNTLYPYEPAHLAAQQVIRKKMMEQFLIEPKAFDDAFDKARQQVKSRLLKTASSHSRLLYFQYMLETMGLGSQVLLALDLEQTYWRTFLSNATLFEGVKEVLDDIRLLNIPMMLVTDLTAQIQFRKMIYFGLDHYFDYIVTSEEVGFDKPHPAIFQLALKKQKLKAGSIWMIGDNVICDIRGAKEHINAITLQKIHGTLKVGEEENRPDAAFHHFSELRQLLKEIGGRH